MAERPEPLVLSLPLPTADAFELYQRLAARSPSFLLESGSGGARTARYSFLCSDPYLTLSGKGDVYQLRARDGVETGVGDPFEVLMRLLRRSRMPRAEGLPPFFGGAVGYFGYDLVRRFEAIPTIARDDLALPDLFFAFVDLVAAVDQTNRTLELIFAPPLERLLGEPREKLYREGCDRLAELEARLATPRTTVTQAELDAFAVIPDQTKVDYVARVGQCKEYIAAGDIYQANVSHRFTITPEGSEPGRGAWTPAGGNAMARRLYGRLRRVNPSPFSALLDLGDLTLISCSPERLVQLQGRRVDSRPIAGTRPRGAHMQEDRRLAEELLTNPKERAEHIMLVDLERNDLGRVCRFGSVRVDEFMVIERYSHVSHIVSNVTGTLRDDVDAFDLVRAVFPGGTITGVPKIRCMNILESLEPVRRGPYTGALGYLSWSGDLDLNIIIRTLVLTGGRGYLQVGAGIVADSDPMKEYDETLHKAQAFFEALRGH